MPRAVKRTRGGPRRSSSTSGSGRVGAKRARVARRPAARSKPASTKPIVEGSETEASDDLSGSERGDRTIRIDGDVDGESVLSDASDASNGQALLLKIANDFKVHVAKKRAKVFRDAGTTLERLVVKAEAEASKDAKSDAALARKNATALSRIEEALATELKQRQQLEADYRKAEIAHNSACRVLKEALHSTRARAGGDRSQHQESHLLGGSTRKARDAIAQLLEQSVEDTTQAVTRRVQARHKTVVSEVGSMLQEFESHFTIASRTAARN